MFVFVMFSMPAPSMAKAKYSPTTTAGSQVPQQQRLRPRAQAGVVVGHVVKGVADGDVGLAG